MSSERYGIEQMTATKRSTKIFEGEMPLVTNLTGKKISSLWMDIGHLAALRSQEARHFHLGNKEENKKREQ